MIYIHEHLFNEDQYKSDLIDALHETMDPLAGLYRALNKKDGSTDDDIALVIETLLEHAYQMQGDIVDYLMSKTGTIKVVIKDKNNPEASRTCMHITGLEINGKLIE